jgi:hypothetical protein
VQSETGSKDLVNEQIGVGCQLESFTSAPLLAGGPPSRQEPWRWYLARRGRNFMTKIMDLVKGARWTKNAGAPTLKAPALVLPAPELKVGDRVRVQSEDYIKCSLDQRGAYKGCCFAIGMYQYCGKEMRVARVVDHFFDEALGRMLKAKNMVLLEGAYCDGSINRECWGCDRMCFYFWRTEWLEKLETR